LGKAEPWKRKAGFQQVRGHREPWEGNAKNRDGKSKNKEQQKKHKNLRWEHKQKKKGTPGPRKRKRGKLETNQRKKSQNARKRPRNVCLGNPTTNKKHQLSKAQGGKMTITNNIREIVTQTSQTREQKKGLHRNNGLDLKSTGEKRVKRKKEKLPTIKGDGAWGRVNKN